MKVSQRNKGVLKKKVWEEKHFPFGCCWKQRELFHFGVTWGTGWQLKQKNRLNKIFKWKPGEWDRMLWKNLTYPWEPGRPLTCIWGCTHPGWCVCSRKTWGCPKLSPLANLEALTCRKWGLRHRCQQTWWGWRCAPNMNKELLSKYCPSDWNERILNSESWIHYSLVNTKLETIWRNKKNQ